ncbi:hypothetical protein Rumi2_15620 [[Ruminococcus] torques]|nr:hypothetical protein Rumi1_12320 [[Ruminococcus] torques]BEI78402.1 hypothetical protein Rumi2_15620 [[Ruminococcus] torques]
MQAITNIPGNPELWLVAYTKNLCDRRHRGLQMFFLKRIRIFLGRRSQPYA